MTYTEEQKKKHIYDLQNALYHLSLLDRDLPRVVPDGIFGPKTTDCVQHLQRRHGLPETGRVDHETWGLIFSQYTHRMKQNGTPLAIQPFTAGPLHIEKGYVGAGVGMAQIMLWELSRHFKNIQAVPITMTYDASMIDQLHRVQSLSGLAKSDVLNNGTWNALTMLYNAVCGQ